MMEFIIEWDVRSEEYLYFIVFSEKKKALVFRNQDSSRKLLCKGELTKLQRSIRFGRLAKKLGLTKKELISIMGYASSVKHWEPDWKMKSAMRYWDSKVLKTSSTLFTEIISEEDNPLNGVEIYSYSEKGLERLVYKYGSLFPAPENIDGSI